MIARKYKHILGVIPLNERQVLINRVGCALVPLRTVLCLIRRQYVNAAVSTVEIPRLTVAYVIVKNKRLVLR